LNEIDELYADSGEPVRQSSGISRGTALKVGGLGLVGALATFLPGRAGASAKRVAANSICQGTASFCLAGAFECGEECGHAVKCSSDCFCLRIYYGRLIATHAPVGACANVDFPWDGDQYGYCGTPGQRDCPGKCYPRLCPGPNCPEECNNNPCWGPTRCPRGTFCADPYSLDGCGTKNPPYPVCAPVCGVSQGPPS
jgi:hypothetical protein